MKIKEMKCEGTALMTTDEFKTRRGLQLTVENSIKDCADGAAEAEEVVEA